MSNPRIVGPAENIHPHERYCTLCKKPLSAKAAWLELDQRTNRYHDAGDVPPELSQGWFPFGLTCAKRLLKQREG
jgi:hypothetical protein